VFILKRKNMKIPKCTIIDTAGQWTPIIYGIYSPHEMANIGQQLLGKYSLAGQVAFIDNRKKIPVASMMGNELSINGAIAAGYVLQQPFTTRDIVISPTQTATNFPSSIIQSVTSKQVILTGIKYKLISKPGEVTLDKARRYCGDDLAAGYIIEKSPGEIIPIVYVKATGTLITETACGSASLSYYLLTGNKNVIQPSGKVINIYQNDDKLSISTTLKEIYV
jgi:hypothetical protein